MTAAVCADFGRDSPSLGTGELITIEETITSGWNCLLSPIQFLIIKTHFDGRFDHGKIGRDAIPGRHVPATGTHIRATKLCGDQASYLGVPSPEEPLYLLKGQTSFCDPGATIRRPASYAGRIAYEGELGIVCWPKMRGSQPRRSPRVHIRIYLRERCDSGRYHQQRIRLFLNGFGPRVSTPLVHSGR